MIKSTGMRKDGGQVLLVGLSGENVTRLVADEPVVISARSMTGMGLPPLEIDVFYGRTDRELIARMQAGAAVLRPPQEAVRLADLTAAELARRIRQAIAESGRTQEDVAAAVKMTSFALSRALNGQRDLKALEVAALCAALGVSPARILAGDPG